MSEFIGPEPPRELKFTQLTWQQPAILAVHTCDLFTTQLLTPR